VPKAQRGYISEQSYIDFELYKKCIDDLCKFPEKIKMLRFAGTGEPLLHKDIVKMVKYAAERQVAILLIL
jgi:MoaA/NifB/PqqE/SkfB family radical SAM enzyme